MKLIHIVKKVDYTFVVSLVDLVRLGLRAARVPANVSWVPIDVKSHPSMVSATKVDGRNEVITTTLKMVTPDELPVRRRLVFRVTLTDGRQYLLGSNTRPYTNIAVTENCPSEVKDNQLNEVVVTYVSKGLPLYIKV
jgi:hypothetical protein|nr:MAG TPA: hypothetical protein [Caudoviricetes sp.]